MPVTPSSIKTISGIANEMKSGRYFASGITNINYNVTGWSQDSNGLTAARQNMIRDVFKYYTNALGINFNEVSTSGANTIRFRDNDSGAWSHVGPNASGQTTINIAASWNGGSTAMDSYSWFTAVHEVGHTLGLLHPGNYNGAGVTWAADSDYWNDTRLLTTMSYFNPNNGDGVTQANEHSTITGSHLNNATLMAADYYAFRDIYSNVASVDAHSGNTTLGFNTNISLASDPVWNQMVNNIDKSRFFYHDKATGSYDTLDVRNFADNQRIDLRVTTRGMTDAYWSNIGGEVKNLAFADHSVFERAISGSGNDTVIGNRTNNSLYGMIGNDKLYGLSGRDSLFGSIGHDKLYGGSSNDKLYGGSHNDYLNGGSHNDYLNGGSGLDKLVGSTGHDKLYGGSQNDKLYGGSHNDYLNGGSHNDYLSGGSGLDKLVGSTGLDRLYGGSQNDKLYGGAHNDYLNGGSHNDYLSGGSGGDTLVGSTGNDRLYGGSSNDRLSGGDHNDYLCGGTGGDVMSGGRGRDIFRVQKGVGFDKVLDFADGQDRILLGNGTSGVSVTNAGGHAYVWQSGDLLARVNGAAGDLTLAGNYLV